MRHKKKKSSIQKKNEFEGSVFLVFSKLLSNDGLFIRKEGAKIYRKKGYYSEDRKGNIIFDISIELFIKDAINYSLLTVIECKNYKELIPVDDIEEFKAKLDQIAGKNAKGIMVSSTGFAEGTLKYAKTLGMALVRLSDSNEINWDIYRVTHTRIKTREKIDIFKDEIHKGLINNIIHPLNSNYCFCKYRNNYYNSSSALLFDLGINSNGDNIFIEYFAKKNFVNMPYIKKEKTENMANAILTIRNKPDTLETSLDMIEEYITEKYGARSNRVSGLMGLDRNGNQILARFSPRKMTIKICSGLDEHRKQFTIARETGRVILHNSCLIDPVSEIDLSINNFNDYILDEDTVKRAEIQENIFAAYLLMPEKIFQTRTIEIAVYLSYKPIGDYLVYRRAAM
jgi:Zn-dependent peptidase ImmA (M78 family)